MPERDRPIFVVVKYFRNGERTLLKALNNEERARYEAGLFVSINSDYYIGIETVVLVDE